MRAIFHIALFVLASGPLVAQGQSSQVFALDEKPFDCIGFAKLVQARDFQSADAMLAGREGICDSKEYFMALAQLKAAQFDFVEAERILETQVNAHPEDMELQKEWNHMVRLLDRSGDFLPINVWPSDTYAFQSDGLIACMSDTVPLMLTRQDGPVTYYPIKKVGASHMLFDSATVPAEMLRVQAKMRLNRYEDIGPGTYMPDGSLLLTGIKQAPYKRRAQSEIFEIVQFDKDGQFIGPISRKEASGQDAFPVYCAADSTVIFSSDRPGGMGGMDLWQKQLSNGKWTVAINLGPEVNSPGNEIFATISGDTLYYASDRAYEGYGGYDIYGYQRSTKHNWNLGIPLNGPHDEHSFHVLGPGRAMLVSNRNGETNENAIYTATWSVKEDFFDVVIGQIANAGDLTGKAVIMTNEQGAEIQRGVVGADGKFTFRHVKGLETYSIVLADQELKAGATLKVMDGTGKLLQEVQSNGKQGFKFVLLNPIEYILEKVENEDQSILSVSILGMMDNSESDADGLTIVLLDAEGNEIAKTITSADGTFGFESVAADEKYQIVSEVRDAAMPIHILDAKGEIMQTIEPDKQGSYAYVRIAPEDGVITLSNEYNKRVRVSNKDLFNLGAVQYELNSYTIAKESAGVLDRLAAILLANPEIAIELSSHTDSRGQADFNLKLSQKRLNSAIAYLKYKGIDSTRLSGTGYGESKLLNQCDDETECTEEEHAVNRRTEFRLKELKKKTD